MRGTDPDERFSAAARAALVDMVDGAHGAGAAGVRRPRWVLQAVVAASVLGLVVTVSALAIGRSQGVPSSTGSGSPIPSPSQVACGESRSNGIEPFGCDRYVSSDGRTGWADIDWLRTNPMQVSFFVAGGRTQIGILAGCNGESADITLSTTRLLVDLRSGAVTNVACANDHLDDALAFFGKPVAYTLEGEDLTLDNGEAVIHLKARPDAQH